MQAKIKTQPYEYFDPVFDGSQEAPLDTEYNLPDYCADIQKILKCRVIPEISSYVITEDTLACEGVCDIRVLYLDAKGESVRSCEFTKEFSATVKLKTTEEKAVAWIKATVAHMTCRAVSARRIDLHASIALQVMAVVQKQEQITCDIEDETIEKRSQSFPAAQAVNALSHQFTLEEQLPLKNGKPPIETILRREAAVKINDYRVTEEQLAVNGAVEVSFLYLSALDGAGLEKMTATMDFSQIIPCNGGQEGCICDLRATVGETSLQAKEDDVGEYTLVGVIAKVFFVAFLYQPCEIEILDDAYSVQAPLDLHYAQNAFTQVQGIHTEVLKKKCAVSLHDEEIQKVLDIWCEQDSVRTACDKGKMTFRVQYTVCAMCLNGNGRVCYTEKAFDHNFTAEVDEQAKKAETTFRTDIWEYRIADKSTLEVSVETWTNTLLYSKNTMKYLTGAQLAEDANGFTGSSRLLVYYASQGEQVWDIAKSHRAPLAALRAQNELFEETVSEARPLIICNR